MSDEYRACARGCAYRGKHLDVCPWGGEQYDREHLLKMGLAECKGCMPARVVPGTNLCTRDLRKLRELLEDAPDLCAHIRSMIDPLRSGWNFDRDKGNRPKVTGSPAPLNVDLLDAGNEVIQILAGWATAFGDTTIYTLDDGWPPRTTPEEAFAVAGWASAYLVNNIMQIAASSDAAWFARYVLDFPKNPNDWTIRKALQRFPLSDRAYWSQAPCPFCAMRVVRVLPPLRGGDETRYECRSCGWSPPVPERETWLIYFEGVPA